MKRKSGGGGRASEAAENVAVNLLVDDPSLPIEEVRQAALNSSMDLWDEVTRTMVPAADVAKVLAAMTPLIAIYWTIARRFGLAARVD